jgi:hypothetical protein
METGTFNNKTLDHSKNRLDPVSMGMNKKVNVIANYILPSQFQDRILPNLQEATFKADTLKTPDFEASNVEFKYKFYDPNPQVKKTILDRLRLFLLEQSISAFFQFIVMYFSQFIPQILFLIYFLAAAG